MHPSRVVCLRRAVPATRPSSLLLISACGIPPADTQRRTFLSTPPKSAQSAAPCTSNRLSGRTCMISGASSGIGLAIAERFLREGASRIILVGRSFDRLAAAAARLESPTQTAADDNTTDDVATRAPEEDSQLRSRHTAPAEPLSPGSLIESSERLHLLVGDVSDAGSWGRELEKAMVRRFLLSIINYMYYILTPTATRRHPRQRSRNIRLQHPPPHRTIRHLPSPPHKPRRRPAHLARAGPRLHPQQSEEPIVVRPGRPTPFEMHHQRVVPAGAQGRDRRCSLRGFQGGRPWAYAVVGCRDG